MDLFIIHSKPQAWTAVPNTLLRDDARLTWKAKALYSYLLGCPPGWRVRLADLVARAKDGRDAVLAGLQELEALGYIRRQQARSERGKFERCNLTVMVPSCENIASPETGFPDTGLPDTGLPYPDNPTHNKTDVNKIDFNKTELGGGALAPAELFPPGDDTLVGFCQAFPAAWNEMAERAGAVKILHKADEPAALSPTRAAAAKKAWKASAIFRERWRDALSAVGDMPDYCGAGRSGWRIDVDFFLRVGSVETILERAVARGRGRTDGEARPGDKVGSFIA